MMQIFFSSVLLIVFDNFQNICKVSSQHAHKCSLTVNLNLSNYQLKWIWGDNIKFSFIEILQKFTSKKVKI